MASHDLPSAPDANTYASYTLDHHGLVVGMVDEPGAGILNGSRQQRLFAADVEKSERFPLCIHHVNKPKVFALRCQRFQFVDHGFQLRRAAVNLFGLLQHSECRPCRRHAQALDSIFIGLLAAVAHHRRRAFGHQSRSQRLDFPP